MTSIRGVRASASLKRVVAGVDHAMTAMHPRRPRLGLIEARNRAGLRYGETCIRGVRASASLKLTRNAPNQPIYLTHPRRPRLGLIEAKPLSRRVLVVIAASEASAPRPH